MQPRRQSMDSETSSDSWSVIQKNVSQQEIQEISSAEIDFVSSDSEHWDSDSAQDPHEYDTNEDGGNDSLEECDESDGVDEESDCEIVDENEAMQETSARYFVSSEKVYELLDMLNAECCTSMGELMIWSRDSTRAAVLLVFIVTTAIFFTSSIRIGRTRSTADRSDEIFASGLQSRKDFERAFMPVLPRRAPLNFSEVCQPWQKSSWSLPPGLSAPIEPPTGLASFTSRNATLIPESNGFSLYNHPVVTAGARISISRPAKARRNVCSQPEVRRYSSVRSRPSKLHITTPQLKHRDDEPSRPSLPPPPLAAATISISRNAKVTGEVCNEKSKPRLQLQYPKSISWLRKAPVKRLSGPRRPLISFVKSIPSGAKKNDISAVMPAAPKYPTLYKKRSAVAPCSLRHRPCTERNITRKPCKSSKALVANLPIRQLSTYKRRPLAPSWPPLPRRPCVERSDAVQCWKALQDQTTQLKNTRYDWFTRRGQIRAENRRH